MEERPGIQQLLQKFVLDQCSPEELAEVAAYCKTNNLTAGFPTVEEVRALLKEFPSVDQARADILFSNIMSAAKEHEETKEKRRGWYKYAAVAASIVVFLSIGWLYQNDTPEAVPAPALTGNEITLQLENGEIKVIAEGDVAALSVARGNVVAAQKGNTIVYDTKTSLEKLVYNTIKIPYGKRFQLQLSDGTAVHLNAGTTLRYPVKFIAGEKRTVFLEGEAYFEVAKDKAHPFVVNADQLNVQVLGTHFNVSSYPEDDVTDVVLVEGSVGLYTANENFDATKNTVLNPGEKGRLHKNDNSITTKPVATKIYTAWINGELVFRDMTFNNICRKLERKYNVTIVNQNPKLAKQKFNASFKNEPIDKVLGYFTELSSFDYTIKKNIITIK